MKRYFFTTTPPGSTGTYVDSGYHFISIPGPTAIGPPSGYLICMMEEHAVPDPTWTELPHLLESTTLASVAALATALTTAASATLNGLVATDTTFTASKKLAVIHPLFHP